MKSSIPSDKKHTGVYFDRGYWRARLFLDGKRYHLGYYMTFEEARAARKAALKLTKWIRTHI